MEDRGEHQNLWGLNKPLMLSVTATHLTKSPHTDYFICSHFTLLSKISTFIQCGFIHKTFPYISHHKAETIRITFVLSVFKTLSPYEPNKYICPVLDAGDKDPGLINGSSPRTLCANKVVNHWNEIV